MYDSYNDLSAFDDIDSLLEYDVLPDHPEPSNTSQYPHPLDNLTDIQQMAVTWPDKPLLILAGAGTGKTRSLTSRIAWLLHEETIRPWNVLAVTFTRKAAREMKLRLATMTGNVAQAMDIGTFHAISTRLLRDNAERAGLNPDFSVLDADDQRAIIKELYPRLIEGDDVHPRPVTPDTDTVKAIDYDAILDWIEAINTDRPNSESALRNTWLTPAGARKLLELYKETKTTNNALDYTDILTRSRDLLRDDKNVRQYYQNLWRAVLVDEYQDTNAIQEEWLTLVTDGGHNCHLTCVGDDDQSVYSWRGAEIENILRFTERYPESAIIRLEQNFRSDAAILDAANTVIAGNTARHGKTLYTHAHKGDPVRIIHFADDRSEADATIRYIETEISRGKPPSEFAIIARSASVLRQFQPALTLRRIPYTVTAGRKYNETGEIKALTAYIRLMLNRADNTAFRHALEIRPRGFGKDSIDKLAIASADTKISMIDLLKAQAKAGNLRKNAREPIEEFISFIEEISEDHRFGLDVSDIIDRIVNETRLRERAEEYRAKAKSATDYRKAEKLEKQADSIDERIDQYIEDARLAPDLREFADAMSLSEIVDTEDNAIWLGTIHAAKGLEFNTVFLPGWERSLFPSEFRDTNQEEERRLAYVAMTRARKRLFISHANDRITRTNDPADSNIVITNASATYENIYVSELRQMHHLQEDGILQFVSTVR